MLGFWDSALDGLSSTKFMVAGVLPGRTNSSISEVTDKAVERPLRSLSIGDSLFANSDESRSRHE